MEYSSATQIAEPVVSVITVVYNGAETLERTILSVAAQTYGPVEYIVVDGGSSDGTLDIISKYQEHITRWISEPDQGLYDAMNKGIRLARGEHLWFINSGDEIAGPDVLEKVFGQQEDADFYYGETIVVDNQGQVIGNRRLTPPAHLTWKDFKRGMLVSHQSVIVRRSVCDYYDTTYRFSADFNWVLSALKRSEKISNTQLVLSRFLEGGLTRKNILPGLRERFRIMVNHYGFLPTLLHHVPIAFRFVLFFVKHKRF